MKNLLLIRHGKSSWRDASLSDHERPLNKRGKRDAPAMALRLLEKGLPPQLIVSSPAKRALKTAKLMAKALEYPKQQIAIREAVYAASVNTLLEVLAGLDDEYARVLLVGHNPELTDFVNRISAAGIENIPTCGLVSVEFAAAHWRDCAVTPGKLAWFERPPKRQEEESLIGD